MPPTHWMGIFVGLTALAGLCLFVRGRCPLFFGLMCLAFSGFWETPLSERTNKFSSVELNRYKKLVTAEVKVRPGVAANQDVPAMFRIQLHASDSGSSRKMWMRLLQAQDFLDGEFLRKSGLNVNVACGFDRRIWLPLLMPGRHCVTSSVTAEVYFGSPEKPNDSQLLFKTTIRDEAEFVVLEPDRPDSITLRKDPGIEPLLRASIELKDFMLDNVHKVMYGYQACPGLEGSVTAQNPPVDFAFDIFARVEGREYYIGSSYKSSCESSYDSGRIAPRREAPCYSGPIVNEITVVLRPNVELAKQTASILEMWGGELVYEHVPVAISAALKESLSAD